MEFSSFFDQVKIPFKHGIIIAFVYCIGINILHILSPEDIEQGNWVSILTSLMMMGGILLGLKETEKNAYEGKFPYVKALRAGLMIAFVSTILMAFFMFLYCELINPELVDIMADRLKAEMREAGLDRTEISLHLKPVYYHYSTTTQVKNILKLGGLSGFTFSLLAPFLLKLFRRKKYSRSGGANFF